MKFRSVLALAGLLSLAAPALAQNAPLVAGKVVKIDESAGKITIDHQKIPNLDMPAMTMVFRAADPALLKAVKAGDRVKFSADSVNGQLTVTSIKKAK
jgi:Cu(I)/Ag(I) efflux system periplasmic protein CusF